MKTIWITCVLMVLLFFSVGINSCDESDKVVRKIDQLSNDMNELSETPAFKRNVPEPIRQIIGYGLYAILGGVSIYETIRKRQSQNVVKELVKRDKQFLADSNTGNAEFMKASARIPNSVNKIIEKT